ncbi:MAG TPA: TIGR00289 family protein, partial [Thermoplasmata archaeon]|nr:TIGR00289 family protein [Thermoplasmata archaeon]
ERWLGRTVDSNVIDDLVALRRKRRINVSGEGGEFETIVLDGPNFRRRLEIASSYVDWHVRSGVLKIFALRQLEKAQ